MPDSRVIVGVNYRGKGVSPVNYERFREVRTPIHSRKEILRPHSPLFFSRSFRENIPIFPTVFSIAKPPSTACWVKGNNQFDQELRMCQRQRSAADDKIKIEKLRHVIATKPSEFNVDELYEAKCTAFRLQSRGIDTHSTEKDASVPIKHSGHCATAFVVPPVMQTKYSVSEDDSDPCECRAQSSLPAVCNASAASSTNYRRGKVHPRPPYLYVHHSCLVVHNGEKDLPEQTFVDQYHIGGPHYSFPADLPNKLQCHAGKSKSTFDNDEKLMCLIRSQATTAGNTVRNY